MGRKVGFLCSVVALECCPYCGYWHDLAECSCILAILESGLST